MKVAFIGLGRMGAAMARRIVQSGFDVTVYNRTPSKAAPLVSAGALSGRDLIYAMLRAGLSALTLAISALISTRHQTIAKPAKGSKGLFVKGLYVVGLAGH